MNRKEIEIEIKFKVGESPGRDLNQKKNERVNLIYLE
jgi:hypothetical protein